MGAVAVALIAVSALTPWLDGGSAPVLSNAHAAVQKAAADTLGAVSGTIVSHVEMTGRPEPKAALESRGSETLESLDAVFMWNGDDLAMNPAGEKRVRFVDGTFYGYRGEEDGWAEFPADEPRDDALAWIASAKAAFAPDRITAITQGLDDLSAQTADDGSAVYSGTSTVEAIAAELPGAGTFVGVPLWDGLPSDTPATVTIVVSGDGLLRSWSVSYRYLDRQTVFSAEFKDIGSTPPIDLH